MKCIAQIVSLSLDFVKSVANLKMYILIFTALLMEYFIILDYHTISIIRALCRVQARNGGLAGLIENGNDAATSAW